VTLGIPDAIANATNRLPVLVRGLMASWTFARTNSATRFRDPVLARLAGDHQHRKLPQMRILRALRSDLRKIDALSMVRAHVTDISLVCIRVAANHQKVR
jgi:hypothetical protein